MRKDTALGLSGGMAALAHSVASDEIVKNSFAKHAFEHSEIANYKSLLVVGEDNGVAEALPTVTRRYVGLYAADGSAAATV